MTKQEYEVAKLKATKEPNAGVRLMAGIRVRNDYITSLESQVETLSAENAKLQAELDDARESISDFIRDVDNEHAAKQALTNQAPSDSGKGDGK